MFGIHKLVDLVVGDLNNNELDKKWLHILLHLLVDQSSLKVSQIFLQNPGIRKEVEEKIASNKKCSMHFKYTSMSTGEDKSDLALRFGNKIAVCESETNEPIAGESLIEQQNLEYQIINDDTLTARDLTHNIENQILQIHKTLLDALPTNEDILGVASKQDANTTGSIKDMYSTLNLAKRVDAIEIGLLKMANLTKELNCLVDIQTNKLRKMTQNFKDYRPDSRHEKSIIERCDSLDITRDPSPVTSLQPLERVKSIPSFQDDAPKSQSHDSMDKEEFPQTDCLVADMEAMKSDEDVLEEAAAALSVCLDSSPGMRKSGSHELTKAQLAHQQNLQEQLQQDLDSMKHDIFAKLQELEQSCIEQNHRFADGFLELRCSLDNIKADLLKTIDELQKVVDVKSDKETLNELRKFVEEEICKLDHKIDLSGPVAALGCRAIKETTCLSCSQKVIQLDCVGKSINPTTINEARNKIHYNNPPLRVCGGIHTITGPRRKQCKF